MSRHIDAGFRIVCAAVHRIGVQNHVPHSREHDLRILYVERQPRAAEVAAEREDELPRFAAVLGAVDTVFVLWTGGTAECADVDDFRVRRMYDDAANAPRLAQPHVRPGPARI